jgi:hypothetical protein
MANGTTPGQKLTKDDEMLLQGVRGALYGALTAFVWQIFNTRWTGGARAFLDRYFRALFKKALWIFREHLSRNPLLVVAMAELIVETMRKVYEKIAADKVAKGEKIEPAIEVLEKEIENEMPTYSLEVAHEVIEDEKTKKSQPVVEAPADNESAVTETPDAPPAEMPTEVSGEVLPPVKAETTPVPAPTPVIETPAPVIDVTPVVTPTPVVKDETKPHFDGLTPGESAMLATMHRKVQNGEKLTAHDQKLFEILYNAVLTHGDPDANRKSVRDQIIEAFMPPQLAQAGEAIRTKIAEAKVEEAAALANLSNVLNGSTVAPAATIPVSTAPEEMVVIGNGVPTSTPATPVAAPVTSTPTPAAPAVTTDKRSWLARATDLLKTANDKMDAKSKKN